MHFDLPDVIGPFITSSRSRTKEKNGPSRAVPIMDFRGAKNVRFAPQLDRQSFEDDRRALRSGHLARSLPVFIFPYAAIQWKRR
ncbi:hypothetical protein [Sphingomicrobium lutaoense]|uniref:Uncharacterized protein n=1 Tax=Sphingomicrobium lutaoense TaxID=515949 RepID=A0A839Z1I2_9SPHN|nr:hypothetical protein [Sphingomicrobium lutaoense]MBB3763532.1 hypothetical protein [Sphingomicrobium lutaoense]